METPLKIVIGCDHAGFPLKREIADFVAGLGHAVTDVGSHTPDPVDFPDIARAVCAAVTGGTADRGLMICGTGVGAAIAANKIRGIRAALSHDEVTARRAREHHACNVLCLGTDLLSEEQVKKIAETFLTTAYLGGRHDRRVHKVMSLDAEGRDPAPVDLKGV